MRDTDTDWLLILFRRFFNENAYGMIRQHALLMGDWLEDRGRSTEAELLRSGEWILQIKASGDWPPPCRVASAGASEPLWSCYFSALWMPTDERTN